MPTPFEREIAAQINERLADRPDDRPRDQLGSPIASVASELRRRWSSHLLSAEEQNAVAVFHLKAGLVRPLLETMSREIASGRAIPWAAFAEALAQSDTKPSKIEREAIAELCSELDANDGILDSFVPDTWGEPFIELRTKRVAKRSLALEESRNQLWDAVRFLRASRLFEQEQKALEDLRARFPDDPEFAAQSQNLQERWAREILAQNRGVREDSREDAEREDLLSEEEAAIRAAISDDVLAMAQRYPERSVDLALLLHFMDFRKEAIVAIERPGQTGSESSSDPSKDWLRLELLLEARLFIAVLEETARLELAYAGDPEAMFGLAYARARALWGLGENEMAIEMIRSIVATRPGYKSAHMLLHEWSGGEDV